MTTGTPPRRLTEKQRRFIEEYIIDPNATHAAIRAGYSRRTANEQGARLLANVSVAAALAEARNTRAARTGVSADLVVSELDILRRTSVDDYEFDEAGRLRVRAGVPAEAIRAVASVKYRVKVIPQKNGEPIEVRESEYRLWDKPAACRMLGEHTGAFERESGGRRDGVVFEIHGGPMGFERQPVPPTHPSARGRGE